MTLDELRILVGEGESECLKFKRTTGELRAGFESLCAMLNGNGGRVLFGVADDGRIVGQQVSDRTPRGRRWISNDIASQLSPPPAPQRLREDLTVLRNLGLVESSGRGRGARWWLKSLGGISE